MDFLQWVGLVSILMLVFWVGIGVWRYIILRRKRDIGKTWRAALQCIVFWPFSFLEM